MKKYMLWPLLAWPAAPGRSCCGCCSAAPGSRRTPASPFPGTCPPCCWSSGLWSWRRPACWRPGRRCRRTGRTRPSSRRASPPPPPGLLTPAVMGIFLLAASGVLDLALRRSPARALTGGGAMAPLCPLRDAALLPAGASAGGGAVAALGRQPLPRHPRLPRRGRRASPAGPSRGRCCWCPSAAWWCGWC